MHLFTISVRTAALALLLTCSAFADTITFSTSGQFVTTGSDHLGGLSYASTPISLDAGLITSGQAMDPFVLGTFTLTRGSSNENYQNETFSLLVSIQLPPSAIGDAMKEFSATLSGNIHKVKASQDDTLIIDFNPAFKTIAFTDGIHDSSFRLGLTDPVTIALAADQNETSKTLYGRISEVTQAPVSISPVPEASSGILLGTALAAIFGINRLRRRACNRG